MSEHNRLHCSFQRQTFLKRIHTEKYARKGEYRNGEFANGSKLNQRSFYNHHKGSKLMRIDTAAKRLRYAVNKGLVARSAKCIWLEMTWSPLYCIKINSSRRYHTYCTESQDNERCQQDLHVDLQRLSRGVVSTARFCVRQGFLAVPRSIMKMQCLRHL